MKLVLLSVFLVIHSTRNSFFFFFNDTATTEIYTLSLHDALPISRHWHRRVLHFYDRTWFSADAASSSVRVSNWIDRRKSKNRSEEHTSELQSQSNLVCRLLLEKKKKKKMTHIRDKDHIILPRN